MLGITWNKTTWRMGNLSACGHMLEDFPLLFDVRKFQISRINFYLKDLFAGTATSDMIEAVRLRRPLTSLRHRRDSFPCVVSLLISSRFGPSVGETERAVAVTASTQVHLKSFTRAASGKIDDHVWIEKLDLRTHLQAPPSAMRRPISLVRRATEYDTTP